MEGEGTATQGGSRTGKTKISMRKLKSEMAMICEEQKRLREGQREVQQKFKQVQAKISSLRQEGDSAGHPAFLFKYQ
ncbi:hypothetical protein QQP08_021159 [Theobroma cacao]|uniref:Uncharacterized protein isoform 1 n=1 Tax=Theobroma cacao TaxID=3641 RepID=A0A061FAN1_THECC|nr:Uncharacterized protein TCM_033297 isoform 1 [Theobroma cacao]WRX28672.1 hypothetical protein QQP08_021159 [Theobroma cacao]